MFARLCRGSSCSSVVRRCTQVSQFRALATAKKGIIPFNYEDPLNMESCFSDEEKMVRDTARKYAQEVLLPRVVKATRDEHFDPKIIKEMGELGLLGSFLEGYECAGLNSVSYGLINREIEAVDSGYRSAMSVQGSLAMLPIHAFGSEALKQKYLPPMAKGDLIGAFGLTEPNAGSNPAQLETKAVKDGDSWILNGSKTWISNSPCADVHIIWAKDSKTNEMLGFVVDKDMKGVSAPKIEGKMSLRASSTGMILLEDVRVPDANRLNVTGLTGPFTCLNSARFGIAWGVMGAADFCYKYARQYCLDRKQFGKPLASYQLVQYKLADMASEIALTQQAVLHVSRLKDQGLMCRQMVSMIKRSATIKALNIARQARDMIGGNGIVDEYHVMRHVCNLESVVTYEGTADIHALILGRSITGMQAFHD